MTTVQTVPNPFALLMDPESVFAAIARSDRLARLKSQVCRPLDKPLTPRLTLESIAFDDDLEDSMRFTSAYEPYDGALAQALAEPEDPSTAA